ncbi:phosphoacetylglucosamine mutase [Planococcus citri]|uniref:phosphoacetylglucosamine mutase n=1 Tax=Planococcus citri TaxID=170843 RepID=UPI0031F77674
MDFSKVLAGYEKYPYPSKELQYGTSGFRDKASVLEHVAFRVGVLAGIRSKYTKKVIGFMVTASHNAAVDNGIKLIDPDGDMLEVTWEPIATRVVNSATDKISDIVNDVISSYKIDTSFEGEVIIGWDTRPSSINLVNIACEGIASVNSKPVKIALCTTPILHYLVRCRNDSSYGVPSVDGYYDKLIVAFETFWKDVSNTNGNYSPYVVFDGANGVGSIAMKNAETRIRDKLRVNLYNDSINDHEKLNVNCGADHIKQAQQYPDGLPEELNVRCVSFDGDADRIMYYYLDDSKKFNIVDGDKMAVLFATFLKEIIAETKLNSTFGIVQTAYANGSSTRYIKDKLNIDAAFTKTGVKHLHQKAIEYDIGIYFESNGHGTVLFSNKLKNEIANALKIASGEQLRALNELCTFINMINETVGDALSDMLAIETILHVKGWSIQDWNKLYDPVPYKMAKVTVKDRSTITTTDAERKAVTPAGLQKGIDDLLTRFPSSRAFVRPSGTEDIVRVYSEAATQKEADELAMEVMRLVYDLAGGVGDRP